MLSPGHDVGPERTNTHVDYYTGLIYEVVTEGSAPEVIPSGNNVPPKPAKKKGGKGKRDEDDRSDDPTVGGLCPLAHTTGISIANTVLHSRVYSSRWSL